MKCLIDHAARPHRNRELAIWLAAGMVVLSVHAGAAALVLATPGEPAGEVSPAPAVMIELAPEPVAERTDLNQMTEDRADAAESLPQPPAPPLPEPPEPEPEPLKTATIPPPLPLPAPIQPPAPRTDPLEEQMLASLANVAVPLPVTRPAPEAPRPTVKTPEMTEEPRRIVKRHKQKPAPASKAALKAAAMVKQSDRTAAKVQTAGASASPATVSTWKSRLAAHLERRKRFPAAAGSAQGTALVVFRIDDNGRVLSSSLARSSNSPELDQAALDMVRRASPVPPPPAGASRTITAPVRFVRK